MRKLFIVFCLAFFFAIFANATVITSPSTDTMSLAPGKQLTVSTSAVSTALVQRYNGTTLIDQTPISANTTVVFGEYFIEERFRIHGLTGTVTYSESQSTSAISASSAAASITSGAISGVTLSASSVTDTGLTSGRIPFSSTGGLLTDASTLAFASGTLTATNLTATKHIKAGGLPTIGGTDCATTGTVAGADNGMTVTVGSGGSATTCLVTFNTAWANPPACVAQSDTDILPLSMVTTTTTLTVTKALAFTAASKLHILCMGF